MVHIDYLLNVVCDFQNEVRRAMNNPQTLEADFEAARQRLIKWTVDNNLPIDFTIR